MVHIWCFSLLRTQWLLLCCRMLEASAMAFSTTLAEPWAPAGTSKRRELEESGWGISPTSSHPSEKDFPESIFLPGGPPSARYLLLKLQPLPCSTPPPCHFCSEGYKAFFCSLSRSLGHLLLVSPDPFLTWKMLPSLKPFLVMSVGVLCFPGMTLHL